MGQTFDVAIIGGGIAGASIAYFLASRRSVILIEREDQPGHHATGRSAAIFIPTYGNRHVRLLTRASTEFLASPPGGFSETPLLTPRGYLRLCTPAQESLLRSQLAEVNEQDPDAEIRGAAFAVEKVPILRRPLIGAAMFVPDAQELDVAALHIGFLRGFGRVGGTLRVSRAVRSVENTAGRWRLDCGEEAFDARVVVNAGGAWVDQIATMSGLPPLGLTPLRRSAALLPAPQEHDIKSWPMVTDLDETYYFKPDAGKLLASPAEETPCEPMDAWVDDMELAEGLQRISDATTLEITRVERCWAGLRTFARDRSPVIGFDRHAPTFFWSAGQGGYGIQTAPAWGQLAADLICEEPSSVLAQTGLTESELNPARFG